MPDPIYPAYQPPSDGQTQPAPSSVSTGSPALDHAPLKDPAVELIRQKINLLYADEPNAVEEIAEINAEPNPQTLSKHQQYMAELSSSGKSLAEIQAAWHQYYSSLPDQDKYVVWQEFYVNTNANPTYQQFGTTHTPQAAPEQPAVQTPITELPAAVATSAEQPAVAIINHRTILPVTHNRTKALRRHARVGADSLSVAATRLKGKLSTESTAEIKQRILQSVKTASSVNGGGKLKAKHHLQSLAFGLASGGVVLFIFLFGFFNQIVIAPLIQPSRKINDTPIIVDTASTVISGEPKVIIPKINVEIPVDYSQTTTNEKDIELALDKGIVHYPTTVKPGEIGNAAYFGHSSNNIFNPGKYKFAFVLLHKLAAGDVFYLSNGGTTYAYRVFSSRIVPPTEVSVLEPVAGHPSTATLITCDPPGTSINRLIVVGDQISPDSNGNAQPTTNEASANSAPVTASEQSALPGNGPSLWSRIWSSVF